MTRINLIDPSCLTDKHLRSEYRELPRVFSAVRKYTRTPSPGAVTKWTRFIAQKEMPNKFVLGKGHMKFFYNKLPFLLERYQSICYEMKTKRNFNLDMSLVKSIQEEAESLICSLRKDMVEYTPSPEEIYLSMSRLCLMSKIPNVVDEIRRNDA